MVKAVFILKDENELQPFFGVVRFFFRCYVRLRFSVEEIENEVMKDTILAYVTWMTFATPEIDAMNGLCVVKNSFYERDRIISPRRFVSRCVPAPVKGKTYIVNLPL